MVLRSLVTGSRYPASRYSDDPFATMQRALQRTLDDVWGSLPASATPAASMSVRLDVKEDDQAFHITAELPGLSENEVDVTFDDGLLTIRGEKKIERDEKKDTWHVVERSYGSFARQIALPANINAEKIDAKFDKGVLKINLPKQPPAQATAKKINIKAGN
ncbi:MAG: Hsp20 family protein [Alphaproteobacteria bacterium]|nr:Hsp20 family protein [Alphaproteobacteria bacterium]